MRTKERLALGNYIFAGGFTVGVAKHFEVLGHLESGNFGVDTARRNFKDLEIQTSEDRWLGTVTRLLNGRHLDLLYCNPPCAAWSKAGTFTWKGVNAYKTAQHHTSCTVKAADLALALEPSTWVWESVPQAWEHGREFTEDVAAQFMERGYSVTLFFTDLLLHGCPPITPEVPLHRPQALPS